MRRPPTLQLTLGQVLQQPLVLRGALAPGQVGVEGHDVGSTGDVQRVEGGGGLEVALVDELPGNYYDREQQRAAAVWNCTNGQRVHCGTVVASANRASTKRQPGQTGTTCCAPAAGAVDKVGPKLLEIVGAHVGTCLNLGWVLRGGQKWQRLW